MESGSIQYRLGWTIQSDYWVNIVKVECINFLNFYEITAYITSYKYSYKVAIFLSWEHHSCYFDLIKIEDRDIKTILGRIEEHIINNYTNIHWLPKFISILKEHELQYVSTFCSIEVKFPFLTNKLKFARLLIDAKEDNLKELIEKYQNYLINRWKTIEFTNGIKKYTRR